MCTWTNLSSFILSYRFLFQLLPYMQCLIALEVGRDKCYLGLKESHFESCKNHLKWGITILEKCQKSLFFNNDTKVGESKAP